MGRQENYETPEENDEEMTVTLDLDDGTSVTCAIVTILTVNNRPASSGRGWGKP